MRNNDCLSVIVIEPKVIETGIFRAPKHSLLSDAGSHAGDARLSHPP